MRKYQKLLWVVLAFLLWPPVLLHAEKPAEPVRVGLYNNRPLSFADERDRPQGIYVDILQDIAREYNWHIEYISCTWTECLQKLQTGEIDLLGPIAYSDERAKKFDFTVETLLVNWGQVYVSPNSKIQSLLDLQGKTVAVLRNDIHYQRFHELLDDFQIEVNYVEVDDYDAVLRMVEQQQVDAGLTNRIYGIQYEYEYNNVEKSPIVLNPIEIRFATPKGRNHQLLEEIDVRLRALKADHNSIYYASIDHWLGATTVRTTFPQWLLWALGIGVGAAGLLLVASVILQRQVHARTAELQLEVEERKKAEESLKAYAAELERSNRELQDFAYVASHDLQEPLRKIQVFGNRLAGKYSASLDDRGRDYLARMQNAATRMTTLINDLLTFSRVTTHARPYTRVDLNQVVQDVLSDLEARTEETGAQINMVDQLPTIEADPTQMHQLFQNLLSNALKFHKKEVAPKVELTAHCYVDENQQQEVCQITITDNGIGFDTKYIDRVFGVFQRLHSRNEYEGTGVGLALCRKIVLRHHGHITAESVPGQGATFIVTLPTKQVDASTPETPHPTIQP